MRSREPSSITSTSKGSAQRSSAATTRPTAVATFASSFSPAITTVRLGAGAASARPGVAVDIERVLVERVVVAQHDPGRELAATELERLGGARVVELRRAPVDPVAHQVEGDRDAREAPHPADGLLDEAPPRCAAVTQADVEEPRADDDVVARPRRLEQQIARLEARVGVAGARRLDHRRGEVAPRVVGGDALLAQIVEQVARAGAHLVERAP